MDPLSVSASVAGFMGLAIQVTKILNAYVNDVKDAPQEASELNTKVSMLIHVLEKVVDTLQSDEMEAITIDEQSVLSSVVSSCEHHVKLVYKNLAKLRDTNKVKALIGRASWPFKKEDCLRSIETLHRYTQTFEHLLVVSNRAFMSQGFSQVILKLQEQHQQTIGSINIMKENLVPVSEAMIQISNRIETVISLVSDLSRDSAEIKKISEGVAMLCANDNDQQLKEIVQWISPLDPLKRHEDLKSKRFKDTGLWFLQSSKFETWCRGTTLDQGFNPVLACYGIPGAGKSVMTTLVIDTLSALPATDGNRIAVTYFYCDYNDNKKQTAVNMVTALLGQVINTHSHHLPAGIIDSLKEKKSKGRPTLEESYEFLESALQPFKKFFICVDALDECLDEHRNDFLHLIARLLQKFGNDSARIFTTARPQMKACIEKPFPVPPRKFEIEANENDIKKYIESKLSKDENFGDDHDSHLFKKKIMEKIVENSDGMFLLPALQIETVLEQTSISKRRAALESMPKKLEDAFQVTIDRIKSQAPGKARQGMEVLKWVYLAKRPLSVIEMRHALATVDCAADTECLDLDDLPFEKSLTECCHGLVVIDNETSTLRLVHKSLQDFLKDQHAESKLFETGHRDIALTCLRYLSFSDGNASSGPMPDYNTVKRMISFGQNYQPSFCDDFRKAASAHIDLFPLLVYAIYFWGVHARGNLDGENKQLAIDLLQRQTEPHSISRNLGPVLWYVKKPGWASPDMDEQNEYLIACTRKFAGIHVIAYFGLDEIYGALVEKLGHFDMKSEIFGMTALSLATLKGHYEVVRLFLENGAQVDCMNEYRRTPLFLAAYGGFEDVVRLFIEKGANIESKDWMGQTPLFCAAMWGKKDIVRLLIELGAQVDAVDQNRQTALFWAATKGHEDVVRLFIEKGAQIDWKDHIGRTPLFGAAASGRENVVRLLIEKGAEVDSKNNDRQTPLFQAVECEHEDVIRLLIEKKAQVNTKDRDGHTPLFLAAQWGNKDVVRLLRENGAEVDWIDNYGKTPLFRAALNGDEDAVHWLIEEGVSVNSEDMNGTTPLFWAALKGKGEIVSLLIETGADVNSKDQWGETPLFWAVKGGWEHVVQLLIEENAHVDSKDQNGQTPLFRAASEGSKDIVDLLINEAAEVDIKDQNGQTPLFWAAERGHKEVVRILIEQGARVESKDNYWETPLFAAASEGFEDVVRLLIEKGAQTDSKDWLQKTPLFYAARKGHKEVVRLLIEQGAQVDAKDNYGATPLFWAASGGNEDVVRILIEEGARVDLMDHNKRTPLDWATQARRENVVQLLVERGVQMM